jgi:hypothetical protein
VEEEYVCSPFWTDVDPPLPTGLQYGFPMSQFLHMQQFSLGRNARMLAAHSLDRIGEYHQVIMKVWLNATKGRINVVIPVFWSHTCRKMLIFIEG